MEDLNKAGAATFKNRVVNSAIDGSIKYKEMFVEYDYLVCSEAFGEQGYQEIKAETNNYLHLLGINTNLSPDDFFQKCMNKTLDESDFDFVKRNQTEQSVKGSVRQKIKALPKIFEMFNKQLFAEKNFKKNNVTCFFATSDNDFTLGFVATGRPKTLMRRNQLSDGKAVELVLKKKRGDEAYSEIIFGTEDDLEKYKDSIKDKIEW